MNRQSLPAVSDVTKDNFEEFKKADKIVAVAFVASNTDVPAPEFSSTANKHRDDYLFGLSVDAETAEAAGVTPPAIVLYRAFDEAETPYPYPAGSVSSEDLSEPFFSSTLPASTSTSGTVSASSSLMILTILNQSAFRISTHTRETTYLTVSHGNHSYPASTG